MPGSVMGTDTILFIYKTDTPQSHHKDVMYGQICFDYRDSKAEPNSTRLTVGGPNKLSRRFWDTNS